MIRRSSTKLYSGNSRDVEGAADAEDAVLDAEVDEAVPAAPHDGVVHYRRLMQRFEVNLNLVQDSAKII